MAIYSGEIKKVSQADVVICGGGVAGVTAAIASSRNGARTILLEKTSIVGGTATNGLVGPFMSCFDPKGERQIVKGIFDEMIRRMEEKGGAIHPSKTGQVSSYGCYIRLRHNNLTPFHPETLKMVMMEMLLEAGVEVHLGISILDVVKEGNSIRSIIAFDGNQLVQFDGAVIIDCTGDAFVSMKAGVPCDMEDPDEALQPMTLFFWIYNADDKKIEEYLSQDPENQYLPYHTLIEEARKRGEFPVNRNKIGLYHMVNEGEWRLNTTRIQGLSPVEETDMSRAYVEGLKQVEFLMDFFKTLPGLENARIAQSGACVGIRESRRIKGIYTLTEQDLVECTRFEDAIALCSYPVDLHPAKGALTGTSHKKEMTNVAEVYPIPYRILVPQNVDNLLVAGRCVSATHEALGAIRVMPPVFAMAQAAGTAAALCIQNGWKPDTVDMEELQETLRKQGQCIDL
ncbi:FAD-dependent oxidoreductase [Clostridium sp. chh4-2]|nr:FAD-dependent oxidoreductase [Clostridium sp. chh4-2]